MDLKDFVSETLVQIIGGVKEAQVKAKLLGGEINSAIWKGRENLEKHKILESATGGIIQIVDFDVALIITEGKGTKGGIGVFAGGLSLGSQGQSHAENESVSRIKFKVPITLPPLEK